MASGTYICPAKEGILDEVSQIYTTDPLGLMTFSKNDYIRKRVKIPILPPQKKVFILMVGPHSTGKSSFVNWFFGDEIQKTAVAIETSTITFVTTGKRQQKFDGPSTLRLFPFLQQFSNIPNFVEDLSTEMRLPIEDRSDLVTFIDTPGLIPGQSRLPFDLKDILLKLAPHVSLIFIFSDSMNQAFSQPLQQFIKEADPRYHSKMHYFLTRADEFSRSEGPDQVLTSMTQDLSKCIIKNDKSIKIYPIYIPDKVQKDPQDLIGNHIDYICETIAGKVSSTLQTSVSQLQSDLDLLQNIGRSTLQKAQSKSRFYRTSFILQIFSLLFLFAAFQFGTLFGLGPFFWPFHIFIFLIWICASLMKPKEKPVQEIKVFLNHTLPSAYEKLLSYQNELVNIL